MQPALTTPGSTPNLRLSVSALGWAWETEDVDPAPWRVSPPPLSPEGFDRLDLGRRRWEERERPAAPQPQPPRRAWAVAGLCLAREAVAALSGCAAGAALALALLAAWYFGLRDSSQKRPAQRAPEQPAEAD
ncbi:uncharacterized protein LOC126278474 [Schistocerca gregaria]|uniref:uncharacterized protein LOC126278474 n=1 Tax=Schistocerca gregaria TaxID=7010 RepID=UPI00211DCBE8|nr:uncharacterized protein LOC126278474 [Schistocerca gregaria]XP_049834579.1 uncharacterized protein LOC126278474 [Schistocerca gregaria]XP_049834580.1 uncharacterized protein LOC126278474 [Schistocerca gregaria]